MTKLAEVIDVLNEKIGFYGSYLILPLIGVVGWEVMKRYGFNSPTSWAFELTVFIYGVHYSLALAYSHKSNIHVAIDIFESRLPSRARTMLRIITNCILFLPTIGFLTFFTGRLAVTSWIQWEHASSSWAPAVYPYKTIMAVGFLILFLQGCAKLIQDVQTLKKV